MLKWCHRLCHFYRNTQESKAFLKTSAAEFSLGFTGHSWVPQLPQAIKETKKGSIWPQVFVGEKSKGEGDCEWTQSEPSHSDCHSRCSRGRVTLLQPLAKKKKKKKNTHTQNKTIKILFLRKYSAYPRKWNMQEMAAKNNGKQSGE